RHRDVATAVFGPAFDYRKIEKRKLALLQYASFARAAFYYSGKHLSQIGQTRNHLYFFDQPLRRFYVRQFKYALGNRAVIFYTKPRQHSLAAAQRVDEKRHSVTANIFK